MLRTEVAMYNCFVLTDEGSRAETSQVHRLCYNKVCSLMSTIAYLKCSNEPDYYTTFDKFIEISKLLTVVVGGSTEHFCMLRSGCKVFSWQQNHKCFHVQY